MAAQPYARIAETFSREAQEFLRAFPDPVLKAAFPEAADIDRKVPVCTHGGAHVGYGAGPLRRNDARLPGSDSGRAGADPGAAQERDFLAGTPGA